MTESPREQRPSTVVAAFGLGCAVAALLLAGDLQRGVTQHGLWYVARGVSVFGLVLALAHGGMGLLQTGMGVVEWAATRPRPPVLVMPVQVVDDRPDELDPPEPTAEAARLHGWRVACLQAVMYAERVGWTFDALGPGRTGINVMERGAWDAITDHLADCACLVQRDRSPTRYADGWGARRLRETIRQGLPLPYPDGPAPVVHAPRCTEAQYTACIERHSARQAT